MLAHVFGNIILLRVSIDTVLRPARSRCPEAYCTDLKIVHRILFGVFSVCESVGPATPAHCVACFNEFAATACSLLMFFFREAWFENYSVWTCFKHGVGQLMGMVNI
eukprot:TRINITY_DN337_c0_g1_i2.p2 TRINITY_DN337_c0_g1~~TRINITY_DN337_c0_g1_i2.p2  ORF type:complete len:107 (-),score=11.47 TRINITY_DN337_c0_g1_i2:7-327(-)